VRLRFLLSGSVISCIFLSTHVAIAQSVAIGIEGGLRTTGDVSGTLSPESKRYTIGPKVEIRLPLHLSLEVDALYRDIGFTGYAESCCRSSITRDRDTSWEFPMMAKYRLPRVARLRSFAGIGYAPRIVYGGDVSSGSVENMSAGVYTGYSNRHRNVSYPETQWLVILGGVELRARHLLISPEVRYVHWNQPFLDAFGGYGSFRYTSAHDELFVILGIAWHRGGL
jgi:hypothetical protein